MSENIVFYIIVLDNAQYYSTCGKVGPTSVFSKASLNYLKRR